jgi:hypothetical protein
MTTTLFDRSFLLHCISNASPAGIFQVLPVPLRNRRLQPPSSSLLQPNSSHQEASRPQTSDLSRTPPSKLHFQINKRFQYKLPFPQRCIPLPVRPTILSTSQVSHLYSSTEPESPSPILPTPILPTPILPTPILPTPILPTPILPTPELPTLNMRKSLDCGIANLYHPSHVVILSLHISELCGDFNSETRRTSVHRSPPTATMKKTTTETFVLSQSK